MCPSPWREIFLNNANRPDREAALPVGEVMFGGSQGGGRTKNSNRKQGGGLDYPAALSFFNDAGEPRECKGRQRR